jgi:hypothetical protein
MGNRTGTPVTGVRSSRVLPALRAALGPALLTLGVAPYVGMLWERVSPKPSYINLSGAIYLNNQDTTAFIGVDTWFLVLGLLAGLMTGCLGYWRYRRGLPTMLGLTGAAALGSFIARKVGVALGPPTIIQGALGVADGATFQANFQLKAQAVLLAWPVGVVIAYVCLIGGLERAPRAATVEAVPAPAGSESTVSVGTLGGGEEFGARNGRDPVEDAPLPVEQAERGA